MFLDGRGIFRRHSRHYFFMGKPAIGKYVMGDMFLEKLSRENLQLENGNVNAHGT